MRPYAGIPIGPESGRETMQSTKPAKRMPSVGRRCIAWPGIEEDVSARGLLAETRNQPNPVPCFDGVLRCELDACDAVVWDSLPNAAAWLECNRYANGGPSRSFGQVPASRPDLPSSCER